MEFNEVVNNRVTSREWTDREVEFSAIKRIIEAGMKAPSWDHYRSWQFVVLHTKAEKENAFAYAKAVVKKFDISRYENRRLNLSKKAEKYRGKELFIGSVTDPYNPQEETCCRTRDLLRQLQGSGAKISIQTKSDLVLRDIDLIKTFPNARVGFSINTLDEEFRADMDRAVSIQRRLAAMKQLHDAGIRTTCFISPIFPGITDVPAIIDRVKNQCNLVWLENLNLRGSYKADIIEYISEKHHGLMPLYREIYTHGSRLYWETLDAALRGCAEENNLEYLRDDDSMQKPFDAPPVIVNFFYHSEIKKSAKRADSKGGRENA